MDNGPSSVHFTSLRLGRRERSLTLRLNSAHYIW